MCALNNNTKTPTTSDALFCVIFVPDFSFIFLHFLFKKAHLSWHHHQTNKDRTGLPRCRFQSTSWYSSECVLVIIVLFCRLFLFFVSLSLSLSFFFFFFFVTLFVFKSLLSRRSFFLFVVIFPEMIKELPPKKKKKKKKKEKRRKSIASRHRFGFVVVSLKKNASLTFPLYVFNRTNRLGKRPSSLASCTTNSTPRIKRRSASIFYRKRYTWRILEAFDYNCGIQLARSDFDR